MGKRKKPPFVWKLRQPRPDDPMFWKLHLAFLRDPPSSDDDSAEPNDLKEQYDQRDEDDPTFVSPKRPKRTDGDSEECA